MKRLLLFFALAISPLACLIDLEEKTSDFVLETKQIHIPGFPHAFNPSIIRFQDRFLMIFRTGSYQNAENSEFLLTVLPESRASRTDEMGLVFLDSHFEPEGPVHLVDIEHFHGLRAFHSQDPRLVEAGGHLYIVYSNMLNDTSIPLRRVFVSELFFDGNHFSFGKPEYLEHFETDAARRVEKNWPPFDYEGKLLISYTIVPHRVFYPILGTGVCQTIACTNSSPVWGFGDIRGGTPALLDNGEYLAFFHSSKQTASMQSDGKKMMHYFIGAYTFSKNPPFALTRMSQEPIVGKNFYNGPAHKTWKPLRVIFPAGFVSDDRFIWLSYGRQDHEIWIAKLDKKGLFKSLVPVTSEEFLLNKCHLDDK